jgi:hypothetical protein
VGRNDEYGSSEGCSEVEDNSTIDGRADGAIPADRSDSSNICPVDGALTGALVVSSPMSIGGRLPDDGPDVDSELLPASSAKVGFFVTSSPPPLPFEGVGTWEYSPVPAGLRVEPL